MSNTEPAALSVVHGGEPTAAELAALVTALTAAASRRTAVQARDGARARWADRRAALRQPLPRGHRMWAGPGLR